MPDLDLSAGEAGTQTGDSTVPANTGGEQISEAPVEVVEPAAAADDHVDEPEKDEDEMSLEELADKAARDRAKDAEPADEEHQQEDADPEAGKQKGITEARKHITSLEGQITPLRQMEATINELGGMPLLEIARPLLDAVSNPEATAGDLIQSVAEASGRDPEELAWGLLENEQNQAAAIKRFFGDDITPELLTGLVEQYKAGEITLEDADDIFLTDAEKRDRESKTREAATRQEEADLKASNANKERVDSLGRVHTTITTAVSEALKDFAVDEAKDTPEMKDLKEFITLSVNAIMAFEMSQDPVFKRVQGLIQGNGIKAAEAIANGALARKVADRSTQLAKRAQPLFTATVGNLQKPATKLKGIREDPDGAMGQADATRTEEISASDPKWRGKLDAEFEGKIRDLQTKNRVRNGRGQYL